MTSIRELLITLGLDVEQAEFVEAIGLEKLLEKGAEMLVEALKEIPAAINEVIHATAEYADQLKDAEERTGISTDSLQRFAYVAGLAGMGLEDVEISVNHLARTMASAKEGNEEAQRAFARLGVRVTDATGHLRSADDVLGDIAQGLSKLPKGPERAAAAIEVFGRAGAKMLNVLGDGKEGLAKLRQEFDDLGISMDEGAVQKGSELEKNFLRLGMVAESFKRELAGPLIEAMAPVVQELLEWVKANRELISTTLRGLGHALAVVFGGGIFKTLLRVGKAIIWVMNNWKHLAVFIGGPLVIALGAVAIAAADTIFWFVALSVQAVVAAAASAAAWIVAALPFIAIAAAIAFVLLLLDDFLTYLRGGKSVIGRFGKEFLPILASLMSPFRYETWKKFFDALDSAVTTIQAAIPQAINAVSTALRKLWDGLPAPLKKMIEIGANTVSLVGGGASPTVAAGLAVAGAVTGSEFNVTQNISVPPGTSPEDVANMSTQALEDWHNTKLREAQACFGP